ILAQDNGTPSLSSSDVTDAGFAINRPGGDTVGPVLWAGSVRVVPRPPGAALLSTFNATADDRSRGGSRIAAAELFFRTKPPTAARGAYVDVSGAIPGNGSAAYEFVDPGRGADASDYFYRIETVDAANNVANSTSLAVKVRLAFAAGLNLLGMPVDLTDPTFGGLAAGRMWADAWTFDACAAGFGWSSALPSDPSTFAILKGHGFWVNGTS